MNAKEKEMREEVARLHEDLKTALWRANEAVWNPPAARRLDRIYVDAYADLRGEVDGIADHAESLLEMLVESTPPVRPLEAVLADIRALGFRYSISPNDVTTYLEAVGAGNDASQWHTTWIKEDGDVVPAETELSRIRELYAGVVALVETLSYRPDRPTEADIEAFLTAIGAGPEEVDSEHEARMQWVVEPLADLLGPSAVSEAELMYGPGAYNQHEAHVATETRWNVWSKNPDTGEWTVTNANLNEDQANKAVSRRNHPSRSSSFPDAVHVALPMGQTPEAAVATLDSLVFLNPDSEEDAGDTIVTGYHTVAEKSCPNCGHPMMSGPLEVRNPKDPDGPKITAAWWCANCHHSIAPPCQCENPDGEARLDPGRKHCPVHGEEAALARADRERETAASESGEA